MTTSGPPPGPRGFDALRARREQLGLSLADVAAATRINAAYLEALEQGRLDALPEGPYRSAYLRAYREILDLEEPPVPEVTEHTSPGDRAARRVPLWAVRVVAGLALAAMVAVATWQVVGEVDADESEAPTEVVPAGPDQRVAVRARRTTRVRVLVDGEEAFNGRIPAGERMEFAGEDRVEVELTAAEAARVEYNGDVVVPQGRQDVPRRLVFIDDLGGGG